MDIDKKRYNEILGWIINIYPSFDEATKRDAEYYFPELKESEGEKIKQELIEYHKAQAFLDGKTNNKHVKFVAWLEKQGEQKPIKVPKFKVGDFIQFNGMGHTRYTVKEVCGLSHYINTCNKRMDMSYTDANFELVEQKSDAWSEEDEDIFKHLMDEIVGLGNSRNSANRLYYDKLMKFLHELKNRAQPREEWRDKDERMLDRLIAYFEKRVAFTDEDNPRYANWLKSLRPQSHWKPSDEQMNGLKEAIEFLGCTKTSREPLQALYEQLKKLK